MQSFLKRRNTIVTACICAVIAISLVLVYRAGSKAGQNSRGPDVPSKAFPANKIPALPDQRNLPMPPETARELNAARPFDVATVPPAAAFIAKGDPNSIERAASCLAAAAWYEAGDDPDGERSVVQVVLNRARHPAFPASICGVVFQGQERTTGCQFSFTCDGAMNRIPSAAAWQRALAIGRAALAGEVFKQVGYATHYHTDWVFPYWGPSLVKLTKFRTHIFYRWPGFWGTRAAFRQTVSPDEPVIAALAKLSSAHGAVEDAAAALPSGSVAAAPPPPLAPPIVIPGISTRSMRGSVVRAEPDPNVFFLQLEDRDFAGNFAISALAVCKNKPVCRVYGWTDPAHIGQHLPLAEPQKAALSFYYERAADGSDKALWNCRQVVRKNPAQCLP
ncbi:MAG: cell wall hydrolase [Novosphingobium sp.]